MLRALLTTAVVLLASAMAVYANPNPTVSVNYLSCDHDDHVTIWQTKADMKGRTGLTITDTVIWTKDNSTPSLEMDVSSCNAGTEPPICGWLPVRYLSFGSHPHEFNGTDLGKVWAQATYNNGIKDVASSGTTNFNLYCQCPGGGGGPQSVGGDFDIAELEKHVQNKVASRDGDLPTDPEDYPLDDAESYMEIPTEGGVYRRATPEDMVLINEGRWDEIPDFVPLDLEPGDRPRGE
ncbi:MAG: hypothetical protein AAFN78_00955 [Pseudomonadota bacterium]